jgi:hypothetical protein
VECPVTFLYTSELIAIEQVAVRLDDGVAFGSCLAVERLKRCRIVQGTKADAARAPGVCASSSAKATRSAASRLPYSNQKLMATAIRAEVGRPRPWAVGIRDTRRRTAASHATPQDDCPE